MAVIKCSLKNDGRLKVVEVLEFQEGDTIEIERSAGVEKALRQNLVKIIPCPGEIKGEGQFDCWKCIKPFGPGQVLEKPITRK
jgi:hypothetical protein